MNKVVKLLKVKGVVIGVSLFHLFTFLPLSVQAKEYKYSEVPGDLMKTRIYTLDNGLKVYLSVNKELPRIQTYIAVRTGSNDPAETTGLAHYLEHLMFKGTTRFGTNPEAEAPLLADIEQRYEAYRKLTDPCPAQTNAYHEIDSVSCWLPSTSSPTSITSSLWPLSVPKVPMPTPPTM